MLPLISVIVPIYRVEKYLDECVLSIIHQTYRNLEIILVDDGSPDGCPELCDEWAGRDNRIRVIHKKNGGLSDARNAGLDIACGQYISFIDSDDWVAYDMLEIMLEALQRHDAQICCCGIKNFHEEDQSETYEYRDLFVGDSEATLQRLYHDTQFPVSSCNKLTSRNLWEKLRFPVGKICEDAMTTYLLVDAASRVVQIPNLLYTYRIRRDSIMTSSFSLKKLEEEEAWRKNYDFMVSHYPNVAIPSRKFWLEHVNALISQFPSKLSAEEKQAKGKLKKTILANLCFILKQFPIKKQAAFLRTLLLY